MRIQNIFRRTPRKPLIAIFLLSVFAVGIGVGSFVNNQTTVFKPTTYTVNVQNSQFQLNQATILWASNAIRLNMTNLAGSTLTDQVQITFFNATTPLGISLYSLTFTPSNETAAASLGGFGCPVCFQLLSLQPSSRIIIQV